MATEPRTTVTTGRLRSICAVACRSGLTAGLAAGLSAMLAAGLAATPAMAQFDNPFDTPPDAPRSAEDLVKVQSQFTTRDIGPGETVYLAVTFRIEPHWHIYWHNPGQGGAPTDITVDAPDGFTVGKILWPRPEFFDGQVTSFGYEREATLFLPVTAPDTIDAGELAFRVTVDYLVCRESCLIGSDQATVRLRAVSEARPELAELPAHERITDTNMRLKFMRVPAVIGKESPIQVEYHGDAFTARIPAGGYESLRLFPHDTPGVTIGTPQFTRDGEFFVLRAPIEINRQNSLGQPLRLAWTITLGEKPDGPAFDFIMPLQSD